MLPNSLKREIEHRDLVAKRQSKQEAIAKKKGRASKDEFKTGDRVRVRDPKTGKWDKIGTITEERDMDGYRNLSFVVEMENGWETICHKAHLWHKTAPPEEYADQGPE